ncbi:PLDc N-terminal domain-containing protein [Schumannella luteola]
MLQIILSVAVLAATIATLANIILSDEWQVKHLPKVFWIILVIIVPIIGMVLWWAIGRDYGDRSEAIPFGDPRRSEAIRPAPSRRLDDEEDIDAAVEREIAFHENEARIRRLEAQLREKRDLEQ